MLVQSAIDLIGEMVYKPGWTFEASDHTDRFEHTVKVRVTYPATMSEREEAPRGYPTEITPHGEFAIQVDNCRDEADLFLKMLVEIIAPIDSHEAREFLRVRPTFWAPYHPHTADGMRRWAERTGDQAALMADMRFGVV